MDDPVSALVSGETGINWTQVLVTAIVTGFPLVAAWITLNWKLGVIKTEVNSNTTAAAAREEALRQRIKAQDEAIRDLREERARGRSPTGEHAPGAAMIDPETPLVVLDPTVGPKVDAK